MKRPKQVRRSITLPADIDSRVQKIARREKRSANRVLENLIETALRAKEAEKRRFFEIADRLRAAEDPDERQRLGDELGRMVFGD